jgi:hypothetical protein
MFFPLGSTFVAIYGAMGAIIFSGYIIYIDAQFPPGDVARLLDSWLECSECEYLHNEEDNRIEEKGPL